MAGLKCWVDRARQTPPDNVVLATSEIRYYGQTHWMFRWVELPFSAPARVSLCARAIWPSQNSKRPSQLSIRRQVHQLDAQLAVGAQALGDCTRQVIFTSFGRCGLLSTVCKKIVFVRVVDGSMHALCRHLWLLVALCCLTGLREHRLQNVIALLLRI